MFISTILGFSRNENQSAHIYFKTIAYDQEGKARHIIFKKNKHPGIKGQNASELEACFTGVANLFCAPHRALQQTLVLNYNGDIIGVASEHAAHALLRILAQKKAEQFLLTEPFSPSFEVSTAEFSTWLSTHKPITSLLEEHPISDIEDVINLSKSTEKEHTKQLNTAFEQRLAIELTNKKLDALYVHRLTKYCKLLLLENKELNIEDAPEEFRREPDLLKLVFENVYLNIKHHEYSDHNRFQAVQISLLGVGKGFNFLNKVPQNFFSQLLAAKKAGMVNIDMDSIADVFTTAYGLEEDDLHKANIGYYVTQGEANRPCFHFFKIDHDLIFNEKLMAARSPRFVNIHYNTTRRNFAITARDLLGFPDLQDSGNHYWPTKNTLFSKGNKAYHSHADRKAYKSLKHDPEFEQAKWKRFLKQIILPHELITRSIKEPLNLFATPQETNETTSLVQRALSARISELRVVLLSIPKFREFLAKHHEEARAFILKELDEHAHKLNCSPDEITQYHLEADLALDSLLIASALQTSSTTLHTTIITQGYRCYETASYFKKQLNSKDGDGLTPLDHAIEQFEIYTKLLINCTQEQKLSYQKMVTYFADVVCDLHRVKAQHTLPPASYQEIIKAAKRTNSMEQLPTVTSLVEYEHELEKMRAQPNRSLKQDKVYAVALLKKAQLTTEDLEQLKTKLSANNVAAPLKFIKELRSELYLIKLIRGAYGRTTTLDEMNACIAEKLAQPTPQKDNEELSNISASL